MSSITILRDDGPVPAEATVQAAVRQAFDLLARPDAHRLAVIGLGPVGRAHLRHARVVRRFTEVRMWSRTATEADLDGLGGDVHLAASADEAAAGADVVLLCTSAAAPVVDARRLAPGSLITSVSTNAPMAHEIDPAVLGNLDVYADYAPAAFAAGGEMRLAAAEHGFTLTDIRGDLAGLLTGAAPAPTGARPVFFRSVGLGIEDAAVALAALQILETSS